MKRAPKKRCQGCPGRPCPDKAWFKRNGRQIRCQDCQDTYRARWRQAYNAQYQRAKNKDKPAPKGVRGDKPQTAVRASLAQAHKAPTEILNPKAACKLVNAMINAAS